VAHPSHRHSTQFLYVTTQKYFAKQLEKKEVGASVHHGKDICRSSTYCKFNLTKANMENNFSEDHFLKFRTEENSQLQQ